MTHLCLCYSIAIHIDGLTTKSKTYSRQSTIPSEVNHISLQHRRQNNLNRTLNGLQQDLLLPNRRFLAQLQLESRYENGHRDGQFRAREDLSNTVTRSVQEGQEAVLPGRSSPGRPAVQPSGRAEFAGVRTPMRGIPMHGPGRDYEVRVFGDRIAQEGRRKGGPTLDPGDRREQSRGFTAYGLQVRKLDNLGDYVVGLAC